MSARAELYRVVRDLKNYLRWQQASGAAGSVPAPADEREAFEARDKAREQAKLERIKSGFQAETGASDPSPDLGGSASSAGQQKSTPSADTGGDASGAGSDKPTFTPDFSAPSEKPRTEAPRAADDESTPKQAPWKSFGSRPQRRFGSNPASNKPRPESNAPKSAPSKRSQSKPAQSKPAPSKPTQPKQMSDDQPPPFDDAAYPEAAGMMREGTVEQPDDMRGGPQSAAKPAKKPAQMTSREKLDYLINYMGDCRRCGLCEHRTNIAFGTGDAEAKLVFVGEAPGFNEDKQGEPFVGKAGQLLDKMIEAMGLSREQVYICNVIKCRPPDNRNPHADEIRECSPFLRKQLEAIEPQVIVTLGKFASQFVTGEQKAMGALRGKWHQWEGVAVMPTYHPAYLLRSPDQKGKTWSDLQMVMEKLGL